MTNISAIHAAEIRRLEKTIRQMEIRTNDDVREYITCLTKLIYDYKMIGLIYEYYTENIEYHKQNKQVFLNIEDVVRSVADLCAAFPNLRTNIENIIVYKQNDDFYKVSRRLHYWGNNYGASKYGPPTGKSLANNCLNMSMIYLQRIDGIWKITFEINNDSEAWMEEVMTGRKPEPAVVSQEETAREEIPQERE